jgi:hypothetical protein
MTTEKVSIAALAEREKHYRELREDVYRELIKIGDMLDHLPRRERLPVIPLLLSMADRASRPLKIDAAPGHGAPS